MAFLLLIDPLPHSSVPEALRSSRREGFEPEIQSCRQPMDALRVLRTSAVDLAVVHLPDDAALGWGADLIHEIRVGYPLIPTLALTATSSAEWVQQLFRAGADDVVLEPNNDLLIARAVARAVEIRAERQHQHQLVRQLTQLNAALQSGAPAPEQPLRIAPDPSVTSPPSPTDAAGVGTALDGFGQGVLLLDSTNRIVYANAAAVRVLGQPEITLRGQSVDAFMQLDPLSILVGREGQPDQPIRLRIGRPDGSTIPVGYHIYPRLDSQGRLVGTLCLFRELSDDDRTRTHERRIDRIGALASMVDAISHHTRNPLTAIRTMLQTLDMTLPLRDEASRQCVVRIGHEVTRINDLLGQAFSFARLRQPQPLSTAIGPLVAATFDAFRLQAQSEAVRLLNQVSPQAPRVLADAGQLQQVFAHLTANALEAMATHPGQRHLIVTAETTTLSGRQALRISWRDRGPGFTAEALQRAFEPFFTTKHENVGLGLTVCYKVIHEHFGEIEIDSGPQGGATVHLTLPLAPL